MEAIVLAGGFGTRLRHILPDVPKPMAPVNGKPFLEYLLAYLARNRVQHVVLAVGYLREQIMEYFGTDFHGMTLSYSIETEPLLTGGAIKKALTICNEKDVFVLNGDTFFNVDLLGMEQHFREKDAALMIAVREMRDFSRYGTVKVQDGYITSFVEKQPQKAGVINGGIYLMKEDLLTDYPQTFSFETDVMEQHVDMLLIAAHPSDGYFIDIGVPEDYTLAQKEYLRFGE